jgi:hypothetical protein
MPINDPLFHWIIGLPTERRGLPRRTLNTRLRGTIRGYVMWPCAERSGACLLNHRDAALFR